VPQPRIASRHFCFANDIPDCVIETLDEVVDPLILDDFLKRSLCRSSLSLSLGIVGQGVGGDLSGMVISKPRPRDRRFSRSRGNVCQFEMIAKFRVRSAHG
jgi:hypothetical protein